MKRNFQMTAYNLTHTQGNKPNVYLAGKIRKHCWRHQLISGLRNHSWGDGPLQQNRFTYIGPFFIGCDHGCFHNKNSHGNVAIRGDNLCPGRDSNAEFDAPHLEVANLCLDALLKADLVFCYIDAADCYGTLVEIGYAIAIDVPLVVAFAPSIATSAGNDFWFACAKARWSIYGVHKYELSGYLDQAIQRYT
jgi:hypothetical protein